MQNNKPIFFTLDKRVELPTSNRFIINKLKDKNYFIVKFLIL